MLAFQQQFVELCLAKGILKFGQFELKSGRVSPYFFNAGLFNKGSELHALGHFYAQAIQQANIHIDVIFGPAYKGIPLAAITASSLFAHYQRDIAYAFDRKEKKTHGEGGQIVGAELRGDILIIDDVITAGTAIRQSMDLIKSHGAKTTAVTIALDRQEKGQGETSAIQELEQQGIKVLPVIKLENILSYLQQQGDDKNLAAVRAYRERYGI